MLLSSFIMMGQQEKSAKLGNTTLEELKMTTYTKDSIAGALVLYEEANRYPDESNQNSPRTDFYFRIKIFDKSAFDLANITVYLRKNERLIHTSAITYNLTETDHINKKYLNSKNIYTTKQSDFWRFKKFTLPNIKEGSVIEYKYSIISPYLDIDDWLFQSDIPKIKSVFKASILGNYKYNIKITGFQKLSVNNAKIKRDCVYVPGIGNGSCAEYVYEMDTIPAFKEEAYMLSKKNYVSKLSFDIVSKTSYKGEVKSYTTTWKKADVNLKNYFFNNQISKKSFFKKELPLNITSIEDDLERAKKVFTFIQNHYTWNGNYWRNDDAKVKNAFNEKSGDIGEINLSLFNSLKAVGIDTKLVVLSTRNNGLPTKLYPIIFDYNYVLVQAEINNTLYYLDATDKFLAFGQIPLKTINGEARVLDFKEDSYWVTLKPKEKSIKNSIVQLSLNENGNFEGSFMTRLSGYFAKSKREKLAVINNDNYLDKFESEYVNIEVDDYKNKNLEVLDKKISETFKIRLINDDNESNDGTIKINPVLFDRVKNNPFKLEERNYPVDFGYSFNKNYSINITIPDNYTILQLPKDKAIALPDKGGSFIYKTLKQNNKITIYSRININRRIFSKDEYFNLKEFYKQIINTEKSLITLKKK